MTNRYIVTVQRIITVEIPVYSHSKKNARKIIEDYGPELAIMDYGGAADISDVATIKGIREEN